MTNTCSKCGGTMERGHATAWGFTTATIESTDPPVLFVVPGTRTSLNPIRAFQQGKAAEPSDRAYRIVGARCESCGLLEFYGEGKS